MTAPLIDSLFNFTIIGNGSSDYLPEYTSFGMVDEKLKQADSKDVLYIPSMSIAIISIDGKRLIVLQT